jgi:hypothetical protein
VEIDLYWLHLVNSFANFTMNSGVGNADNAEKGRAFYQALASQSEPLRSRFLASTQIAVRVPKLQHVVMATVPFMTFNCLFSCSLLLLQQYKLARGSSGSRHFSVEGF